jgi:hypothetical protein
MDSWGGFSFLGELFLLEAEEPERPMPEVRAL